MSAGYRAFFLGAGASRAAGFPMTRDLIYGIAAAIQESPGHFRELSGYLESMFGFGPHETEVAAELWESAAGTERSLADGAHERGLLLLPDVPDVLSTMDMIIAEEGGLGFAGARDGDRFLDAARLHSRSGMGGPLAGTSFQQEQSLGRTMLCLTSASSMQCCDSVAGRTV